MARLSLNLDLSERAVLVFKWVLWLAALALLVTRC